MIKILTTRTVLKKFPQGQGRSLRSFLKDRPLEYGYAILELLFYVVFFSILSLVVINAMITMARVFRETAVYAELVQSGVIMERIGREIRTSYDISSISSSDLRSE